MLEDCKYIQVIVGEPTLRMSNDPFSSERKGLLYHCGRASLPQSRPVDISLIQTSESCAKGPMLA